MTSLYVTHARTLPELRDEFLSDLHRRLASLDLEAKHEERVGRKAAIARATIELEAVVSYWKDIELRALSKSDSRSSGVSCGIHDGG